MSFLIQQTIIYTIPLLIVALAGIFAERSGVINLALEGTMIFGAFIGVLFINISQANGWFQKENAQLLLILTMAVSAFFGALFSLLLSFAAVNMKANQTISGTALNMLSPALTLFFISVITNQNVLSMYEGDAASWFMLKRSDFGFEATESLNFFESTFLIRNYLTTYICIAIYIILSVILYRTKFGLRLRSCGENPHASDSLGINVKKMRYIGTTISGALAGMGGFVFSLTTANASATGDVAGFGFLALAVMIFGNWNPISVAGAAFLFGLFKCIAAAYATIDINGDGVFTLAQLGISTNLYRMLPYVITLVVLAFTSKHSRAPKAEGIPYDKSKR
ncbi:MAG: ABC transporter permease [Clostridia bacterium]|nr:ABC transporter permease [Clostridia bacterium]